ncbi:MAG: adenylate/guanylate cyclase domain-containing protein [Proteobacteria bacterium]|nr:adenylate/guanylate cyclase domain-containing protein [Pseudomonadota bacterium]
MRLAGWWPFVAIRARLPAQVEAAIRAEQHASEIVVGWIQLAVVATFAVLYTLSPKTFVAGTTFAPVPYVLAAYALFTLVRLWLAYRRGLPGWFIALSVVVDIALLLATILSFHYQYRQPASFSLKAPTLLYVFIFIALRTLRLEVRYLLLAGAAAAAGWGLLVLYVVTADPTDRMITRDYVTYLTQNAVLLGAEFDKMISMVVVTLILAFAIARSRRLLIVAVSESYAARELKRFFDPTIAEKIALADHGIIAGHGVLREAAVMMIDVRGFSRLAAEIGPDELVSLVTDYQAKIVPVIRAHGGSIDKFLGDGILASFGATRESETYGADALRAAEAALATIAAWNGERAARGAAPIAVGLAVASGPVILGAIGDESRLEFTVIGDTVNLAAKLEKHNKAEGARALTTARCFDLACAQGYAPAGGVERRPGRAVAGLADPVDLVRLA